MTCFFLSHCAIETKRTDGDKGNTVLRSKKWVCHWKKWDTLNTNDIRHQLRRKKYEYILFGSPFLRKKHETDKTYCIEIKIFVSSRHWDDKNTMRQAKHIALRFKKYVFHSKRWDVLLLVSYRHWDVKNRLRQGEYSLKILEISLSLEKKNKC